MGSGSFAVSSFVIGYDHLKKIVPEEISAIENEKFFGDIGWGTIGQILILSWAWPLLVLIMATKLLNLRF